MLRIDGKRLGDSQRPYIIAEASGNHHRDYATAEQLVCAAAEAGADAIKFQSFEASDICADVPILTGYDAAHDAWIQSLGVTRLRELFALGGLPRAWHAPLKALAEQQDIAFLSTPFSVDAARFLVEEVGVPALKIASGDLTFAPLLAYAASTRLPVILSTGGATFSEIQEAYHLFYHALWPPVFMHCVSAYPCEDVWTNLRAIKTIRDRFSWLCGFSDHTLSTDLVPALAVAMGATVIEKHLRLADDTTSVDAAHSLTPSQFRQMVDVIRIVPAILGDGVKTPHATEMHDRKWARRSPVDWLRPTEEARAGHWE